MDIHVLQGEREFAADNKTIGRFQLAGIPPAPRGTPQIEVEFDIDADGIMHVSAKDKGTGKEQKIVIKASSGLSDDEINRMVDDAEKMQDEDKKKREVIDARNAADALVYQTEKNLGEYKEKLQDDDVKKLEAGIEDIKAALKTDNVDDIKSATDKLNNTWQEVATRMYQSTSADQAQATGTEGAAPGADAGAGPSEEGAKPVDADYEIIDDDKK